VSPVFNEREPKPAKPDRPSRKARRALASSKQGEGYGWRVKAQRIGDHKGKQRERARP